ncbi:hypothetical protein [Kribbella sp. NPDC050470]
MPADRIRPSIRTLLGQLVRKAYTSYTVGVAVARGEVFGRRDLGSSAA